MALPSGTVTFLFTDIEGSTKLSQTYRGQWETMRARHHAILHKAVQDHNGHVFQIIGDEFCVAFHTAIDAVRAAVDAQRMLFTEPWDPAPIKVRMGIHSGTAHVSEADDQLGGYTGYIALARVSRLRSAGHGGQVLISLSSEELVHDELPEDISLRDLGPRRLKDLIRPEQIFQLIIPGLPADFPPLKTLDVYHHNLPTQMTNFIGRGKEMGEIKQAVSNHRLVTLTGSGGTGKTRLALQVAADLLDQFSDGVWFVELASLTDPGLIPQSILSACGVPEQQGRTSMQTLLDYLRDRRLLLILDNCEHLTEACAHLVDNLLSHAHSLNILVTGREPLGMAGEMDWRVPSLSMPDAKHALVIEQLSQYEAVQLFIDRAMLVQPHFQVTRENAPAIAQICFQLDGIPLALELAAARVRSLSVDEISARLNDRFRLLTSGSRTALPRQQTLRATIDWSYNLLTEGEKRLLRTLAVFSGGWTLEAAEQICGEAGDGLDILDLLTRLVEKSLVVMEETTGHSRYRLFETTHQYAFEKLVEAKEEAEKRQRYLKYYLEFAERANENIHGPQQAEWMERLDGDNDNFRAALNYSIAERETESALRLLTALGWTWTLHAHFDEIHNWFEIIRILPRIDDHPAYYATLLNIIGFCYITNDKLNEGRSILEESRGIWLKLGVDDEQGLARSIMNIGEITRFEGDRKAAKHLFEHSLELFRKHADRRGEAECLLRLAYSAADQHEPDDALAISLCEQSLAIHHQLGNLYGIGRVAHLLGVLFLVQGNYEKACSYYEQQLEIDEKLQHKAGILLADLNLGNLHRRQGELDKAAEYYNKTLLLAHEYGMESFIPSAYTGKGMLALQQNDYALARRYFGDAILFLEKNGMSPAEYFFLEYAALLAELDQPELAAKLYGVFQASGDRSLDETELERHIQKARAQLGTTAFEALASEGCTLTLEQAAKLAGKIPEVN
jgi:predicted ATPase/class 3 adenylate cyclase